jgi:hypothetical protein
MLGIYDPQSVGFEQYGDGTSIMRGRAFLAAEARAIFPSLDPFYLEGLADHPVKYRIRYKQNQADFSSVPRSRGLSSGTDVQAAIPSGSVEGLPVTETFTNDGRRIAATLTDASGQASELNIKARDNTCHG